MQTPEFNWRDLAILLFQSLLLIVSGYITSTIRRINKDMESLRKDYKDLLTRQESEEKEISKHLGWHNGQDKK